VRAFASFLKHILLKNRSVGVAVGLTLFLLIESWFYPLLFRIPVLVNEQVVLAQPRADLAAILRQAGHNPSPGDLLDVDGRVLKSGGGLAPRLTVNGGEAIVESSVNPEDRVEFWPGADLIEGTQATTETVPPGAVVRGTGQFKRLESLGQPGEKLVTKGAVSGKIVAARDLVKAKPMVVAHTDVRPEKVIALTFDDGPTPPYTSQIVSILRDLQATGTFFVLGRQAAMHPALIREIDAAGFLIANHSWSHRALNHADEPLVMEELRAVQNVVLPITGRPMAWFRPPYGRYSPPLQDIVSRMGYRLVNWNIDSEDWLAADPDEIVDRVVSAAYPGAVVLMHDGGGDRTNTVLALPRVIMALYGQGYSFVTLDQLVDE
jgi:peptidoglycan-N-acetylglucosamine deacetylase